MGKHALTPNMNLGTKVRWYLVASRTEAVIYEDNADKKFAFVERISNPDGQLKESELDSDKPGTGFSSAAGGGIHHALDRRSSRHEQVAKKFALKVAKALDLGSRKRKVDDLIIAAEPRFLGMLREAMPDSLRSFIRHEIPHEYVNKSDAEVRDLIHHFIAKE